MDKIRVVWGLRQQRHIPTIARMLAEGKDWEKIGNALGWCPATAKDHWLCIMLNYQPQIDED